MNNKTENAKIQYPSLNGLRAISVFLVIFHHMELNKGIFSHMLPHQLKSFYNFLADGQMGVNVFFVISGFLISALLLREEENYGKISLKNFYIRRILRIFPAYYFYLLVVFILYLGGAFELSPISWLTAISFTKYFNWQLDWPTSHGWSLSIEEHFYLLYPLLFAFGAKTRKISAGLMVLLVPMIKAYYYHQPISWMSSLSIFQRIDALALGCLMAFYQDYLVAGLQKHFRSLFYLSLAGLFFIAFADKIASKLSLDLDLILAIFGSRYGLVANLFIGIVVLYSVFGPRGFWFRLLNSKAFNYIGLLSYSLYLWQQLFSFPTRHWAAQCPQNLVFLFLLALLSYYGIEKPFLKLKEKFSAKNE